jgi:hypothetical protein
VRDGAGWRVAGDPRTRVPVSTALMHRVGRLGPGVTPFLQAAAVLGRTFSLSVAAAAAGVPEAEALRFLRLAADARLVAPDTREKPDTPAQPDRYAFRHALTADAMVSGLLPAERARLCAAATAVETGGGARPGGNGEEWLAAELWAAADRPGRAAAGFARAGRRAVERGAFGTAVTFLERGLVLADRVDDPEVTTDLLEALTGALVAAGAAARVFALGDRLDTLLSTLDAPPARRVAARLVRARVAASEGA